MQESISFDKELREAIKETTEILAKAVKGTLGPSGTNVGVLSEINIPTIVNDGVTVAKKPMFKKDPLKKYIASILKTVAQNTDNIAGDGTTTSITLAEAIILEGIKNIDSGMSQIDLSKGIRTATIAVLKELEKKKVSVLNNDKMLLHVATISANNDKELGKIISKAFKEVGVDGQIEIKDSTDDKTYVELVNGMKFPSGSESNMFYNTDKSETFFEDSYVLLFEGKMTTIDPIVPALQEARNENKGILIVCDDYSEEALNDLTYNKINAKVKISAVKSPGFGEDKDKNMEDLADVTGASVISKRFGSSLDNFATDQLGNATMVRVDSSSFTLMNENLDKKLIDKKISKLKDDAKKEQNKNLKEEILDRVARLANGVAVMYVAGNSPVEIAEKKYRIEDAINATRASLEEGIVPGGGVALLRLSDSLKMPEMENRDQEVGFNIIVKALQSPIRTISENTGASPDVVVSDVLRKNSFNYGYDAKSKKYGDMVKAGIIDPVKVTKAALTNASSVSQLLLTMNCAIYE